MYNANTIFKWNPPHKKQQHKKIADTFLSGLSSKQDHNIIEVDIYSQTIAPCRGCYGCWYHTPGACIIKDDMTQLLEEYRQSDLIVRSFPLYYFGMPSQMKAFMGRLMPNSSQSFSFTASGKMKHPQVYDSCKQKHCLISTCRFQLFWESAVQVRYRAPKAI